MTWRLIPLLQASGCVQMSLDRWLLDQHYRGLHPPTLRFYTWKPIALSLGYHQRHCPDHWKQLTWNSSSVELVRRPTGGRAVLHQGDLTYTVVTSGLTGNRMQNYQQICEFLIQGWRSLGVELHYGQAGRGYIHNPNCFGTATAADLTMTDGSKLIGSAQLHRGNTILQHGSIRLNPDPALFQQVFSVDPMLPKLPLSLQGPELRAIVMDALLDAAQRCFCTELQPQPLSQEEWNAIVREDKEIKG